jgi:thiamine biosynthesis lipoprotein
MKLHRSLCALLCALLCASALTGCGREQQATQAALFAMDTVMELTVYGGEETLTAAQARIRELESELSVTDENSEIYALNRTGSAVLGQDAAQLLGKALTLCAQTGGALDVSIYPVVRAWGFTTGEYGVPDQQTLQALLAHVDYTQVALDEDSGQASLPAGMEIDLGSVAKGYTGDQVIALLRREGVTSALLNLGGNIQVLGNKPDGSPWRIGVQNPQGEGYVGVLELTDQAAITSGGYERYFEEDGQTYWHIIDPATGEPARSGLISVTVVGDSGMVCDGLSTALFVMGLDAAAQYWRETGGFQAVLIGEDGQIFLTEGLEGNFTLTDPDSGEIQVIRHG